MAIAGRLVEERDLAERAPVAEAAFPEPALRQTFSAAC